MYQKPRTELGLKTFVFSSSMPNDFLASIPVNVNYFTGPVFISERQQNRILVLKYFGDETGDQTSSSQRGFVQEI
jgi:hypothetical protein